MLHVSAEAAKLPCRPFLVAPYVTGADGALRPVDGIDRCPLGKGDERCRLGKHHARDRTTGPCFPVWVMRCATHKACFTIYPSGHVPYGRERVAPVSATGLPYKERHGREAWRGTFFPRRSGGGEEHHLGTGYGHG